MTQWATYYREIPEAISQNDDLRNTITDLVSSKPIHGNAVEGGNREEEFRDILLGFFELDYGYQEAIQMVPERLPRRESPHSASNQTFSSDWARRLVRTQGSRFYNQGVLTELQARGDEECYIPRSPEEYPDSDCTVALAGGTAPVDTMLDRLERTYDEEDYSTPVCIPGRANCTHAIVPLDHPAAE